MLKDLSIDYKEIKTVSFTTKNGIEVETGLNGDNTVSIVYKASFKGGIQADFSPTDLKEYIEYLQNFYKQTKNR